MRIISYITALCSILLSWSCVYKDFNPARWAAEPVLELSKSGIVFTAAVNQDTVKVSSNYRTFDISCEDSWCTLHREDSMIIVKVEPNMTSEQRSSTVYVHVGRADKNLTKTLSIVQMGGYWDVVSSFSVYWSSDITDSQKETIAEILSDMVYVKGGKFVMGADEEHTYAGDTRHNVTLSDFHISKAEVTQKQWNTIMGTSNSFFVGEKLPVENIEWEEALDFVDKLSRLTNLNFFMPTEAQWEYAARGGIYSKGYIYPGSDDYHEILIDKGPENLSDPDFTTYEVGQFRPNELGLYDMAGNVAEMCYDWYGDYVLTDQVDPSGPPTGEYHVKRGGDIASSMLFWTVYAREPFFSTDYVGLRLCLRP